jgi:DNA replication protein DnaC
LETKSTVLLRHHLEALKLPTMTTECEKVAARCAKENVDHLGSLLQLRELELLERERRAAERRLKAAKFPTPKGLDGFDFAAAPSVDKPMILELMRCEYADRRENVLLIGGSGTGKTHLATALATEACARGRRVRFSRVTELAAQLLEAREERQLGRPKSRLAKLDLLVLDELGYVPASKVGAELLFDVISTACERSSVIVTTNLPSEEWKEVLGSGRLTGATLDRLTHQRHTRSWKRLPDPRQSDLQGTTPSPDHSGLSSRLIPPLFKARPGTVIFDRSSAMPRHPEQSQPSPPIRRHFEVSRLEAQQVIAAYECVVPVIRHRFEPHQDRSHAHCPRAPRIGTAMANGGSHQ